MKPSGFLCGRAWQRESPATPVANREIKYQAAIDMMRHTILLVYGLWEVVEVTFTGLLTITRRQDSA